MSPLIYSEASEKLLGETASSLPHALLLAGKEGIGLCTAAQHLAGNQLEGIIRPTDRDGNVDTTRKGIIRASQIRDLVRLSAVKSRGTRIYVIDDADRMNQTAQNAFLKVLEEPSPQVHFILTTHAPHRLLATIRSRVQTFRLDPVSKNQSELLLTRLKVLDATARQQMLFLAGGLPAELTRLATDKAYFATMSTLMRDARTFLQGEIIDRAQLIEAYQSDRAKTLALLTSAERVLHHSLKAADPAQTIETSARLATIYDRVAANGNIRLQLTSFLAG